MSTRWDLELKATRAYALKDYRRTSRLLDDLLREVGENPNTLHMLARCSEHLGDNDNALAYAQRCLLVNPDHFGGLQVMTQVHYKLSNLDEARRYAEKALQRLPRQPPLPLSLRWFAALFSRRDPELPRAHELHPDDLEWVQWANEHLLRPVAGRD